MEKISAPSKIGPQVDWPRRRKTGGASRFRTAWSRGVIKHRVAAAVFGLGILGPLAGTAAAAAPVDSGRSWPTRRPRRAGRCGGLGRTADARAVRRAHREGLNPCGSW
jgi:hypothetical protein